jgi:DNA repair protein RadA/Sms
VGQVREAAAYLVRMAKENDISLVMVGHVTKDGALAGPKVLEHMVDTVLYFEGERTQNFRILRCIKNRFGSTNEIGIFDMQSAGLQEVSNPSEIFLQDNSLNVPGSMVVSALEGTRSFLVEVQSLVAHSSLSMPRRTFTGIDNNRAAIIIAVLEKKCGFMLGAEDIFINVVGGVRLEEPAADLGIALAIISSFKELSFAKRIAAIGEIGLSGELRTVSNIEKRINEVEKLGFDSCIIPEGNFKNLKNKFAIELISAKTLPEVFAKIS